MIYLLFILIIILITLLPNNKKEHFKDNEYWEIHDPNFLKNANLKYFDRKIKKFNLKEENNFLVDILLKSPLNSYFLEVGAFNGNSCIPIAKQLKNKNMSDINIIAFEAKKNLCDKINKKYNIQHSPIDTTFQLCSIDNIPNKFPNKNCIRCYKPYSARHLDWYLNPNKLTDDQIYYSKNAIGGDNSNGAHWGRKIHKK